MNCTAMDLSKAAWSVKEDEYIPELQLLSPRIRQGTIPWQLAELSIADAVSACCRRVFFATSHAVQTQHLYCKARSESQTKGSILTRILHHALYHKQDRGGRHVAEVPQNSVGMPKHVPIQIQPKLWVTENIQYLHPSRMDAPFDISCLVYMTNTGRVGKQDCRSVFCITRNMRNIISAILQHEPPRNLLLLTSS